MYITKNNNRKIIWKTTLRTKRRKNMHNLKLTLHHHFVQLQTCYERLYKSCCRSRGKYMEAKRFNCISQNINESCTVARVDLLLSFLSSSSSFSNALKFRCIGFPLFYVTLAYTRDLGIIQMTKVIGMFSLIMKKKDPLFYD